MAHEFPVTMASAQGHNEGAHDDSIKDVGPAKGTYQAEDVRVRYTILQTPPILETAFLGFQHYLTMLGATVLIPFLLVPAMGGNGQDLANVICTIFFVSGLITLTQTFCGDRLPIIQGGSFAYLTPTFAVIGQVAAKGGYADDHERFLLTMREVQGAIIGSGFVVFLIGATGILRLILKLISPITVAANIGIVGLALYGAGFNSAMDCPQLSLMLIFFIILFSQYMRNIAVPLGSYKLRLFELFPVLLGIAVTWIIAAILTASGTYDNASPGQQASCKTNNLTVLNNSPWIRFPYPGQWGAPIFTWPSVLTMLAGALCAMVESLGDYYAAARISGAPVPPPDVISRAVTIQGLSCMLAGVWGSGNGTTAYNENVGAMQITGVGSRRVVQAGAGICLILALVGKFGGLFASMPYAMVAGLFCVMFGLIASVGLSQMQHTDQNSPRNLFILGFALFMGLSVPDYFDKHKAKYGYYPINTTNQAFNDVFNSIFHTAAAVALIITLVLDNTIPGTDEERGLHVWSRLSDESAEEWWEDDHMNAVYGLPFDLTKKYDKAFGHKVRAVTRPIFGRRH